MEYELFKVQKSKVDIDFKKLYETIVNDTDIKRSDYDDIEDYHYEVCNYFNMNCCTLLTEVCGLNFDQKNTEPYYDIEANDILVVRICYGFEDYVYNKKYE